MRSWAFPCLALLRERRIGKKMNLQDFELLMDEEILARGYDYYANGRIISVEETDKNVYRAEVEGSELYSVEVQLDDDAGAGILDSCCDCPYDRGEYCKHQAAVFFALRDIKGAKAPEGGERARMAPESTAPESLSPAAVPESAGNPFLRKRKPPDMEAILSKRTKTELVQFILTLAVRDEQIQRRIQLDFEEGDDKEEIARAVALIRVCIENHADRQGFVRYGDTFEAVRGAEMVLEKARSVLEKKKSLQALALGLCVAHEMMRLLGRADDSGGVVGEVISESFGFIVEIVGTEGLTPAEKESIFQTLLKEAANKRYTNWSNWRLELLEIPATLADTPASRKKLEKDLDKLAEKGKEDTWAGRSFAEKVELIRYRMILQYEGQEKACEFIRRNLRYPAFRKMAVEGALAGKDYEEVIRLSREGEKEDEAHARLVRQWKEYRYKACRLAGKLEEARQIALEFILEGSFEHYRELKQTYNAGEWTAVYPRIIAMLENQKRKFSDVHPRILIEEGEKQKLLEYVQARPWTVEIYDERLVPEFQEEVWDLYAEYIKEKAASARDRQEYREVCAIIRKLKKTGGEERAAEIKEKLLGRYSDRPAFKDELSKV